MKKYIRNIACTLVFLVVIISSAYSQEKTVTDSISVSVNDLLNPKPEKKIRKNTILFNITNPLLISNKFQIIGYERVLPNNQSVTLNVGIFSLPKFGGKLADSLGVKRNFKDNGFHFSTDYRFYLKKENKYSAPRGIYLAPYYTYNHLNRQNSWNIEGRIDEVYTNLKVNIHTIGAEMGYQFILWDRVALDFILIGPGYGFYGLKTEIGTNLDPETESKLFDKINEILKDKIPGYDKVINAGDFRKKGTYRTENVGFRYVIRVGYRF